MFIGERKRAHPCLLNLIEFSLFLFIYMSIYIYIYSNIYIQWNLPKTDTIGAEPCVHLMEGVLYSEVFALGPSAYVL